MTYSKKSRIVTFSLITLTWSFIYFVLRPFSELGEILPYFLYVLVGWIPAIGLLIAGLFFSRKLNEERAFSFLGTNKKYSLILAVIPVAFLTVLGIPNQMGISEHLCGLYLGVVVLVYAIFEEYGWRGYLQEEINDKLTWKKYALIGVLWYVWHWSFMGHDGLNFWKISSHIVLFFGAAAMIGQAVKETKSILVGAAFHALGNIVIMYNLVANHLSWDAKLALLGIFIFAWVHLSKKWNGVEGEFVLGLN